MDTMQCSVTGKPPETVGSVSLKCETSAYGLKRRNPLRLNAAQQKQQYPADTSLDRMNRMLTSEFPWISVKYQRR